MAVAGVGRPGGVFEMVDIGSRRAMLGVLNIAVSICTKILRMYFQFQQTSWLGSIVQVTIGLPNSLYKETNIDIDLS